MKLLRLLSSFAILSTLGISSAEDFGEGWGVISVKDTSGWIKDFLKNVRDKAHDAHDANADYQLVTTDTPLEPLLREFLTARLPKAKH